MRFVICDLQFTHSVTLNLLLCLCDPKIVRGEFRMPDAVEQIVLRIDALLRLNRCLAESAVEPLVARVVKDAKLHDASRLRGIVQLFVAVLHAAAQFLSSLNGRQLVVLLLAMRLDREVRLRVADFGLRAKSVHRDMERKRAEIAELETQIRLAREYLQALEDTFKLIQKDGGTGREAPTTRRPGTSLAKAREAIRKAGRPMHLTELLPAVGKGLSRNERAGLSGTLAAYVRRGEIFTRPAPNTFGLLELHTDEPAPVPPAGFGKL